MVNVNTLERFRLLGLYEFTYIPLLTGGLLGTHTITLNSVAVLFFASELH